MTEKEFRSLQPGDRIKKIQHKHFRGLGTEAVVTNRISDAIVVRMSVTGKFKSVQEYIYETACRCWERLEEQCEG